MSEIYTMGESSRGMKRKADSTLEDSGGIKRQHGGPGELGTSGSIPFDIQIVQFAESRAAEIKSLEKEITTFKGTKGIQQRLPRHMRRRAMSHKIKRLPKNLRSMAKGSFANQEGLNKKCLSRYHRRRPKNLFKEYVRRQKKHIWLETHIWHAKRFHMIEKWGHKLPWKSVMKSERAAYRASSQHCLLQDMSYMCCIELRGTEQKVLAGLAHLTNPHIGPTFASKACLQGTKEGNTVLYQYDGYPAHCIGPVSFLWKPQLPVELGSSDSRAQGTQLMTVDSAKSQERQLWFWCHPSCFDLVWRELLRCFDIADERSLEKVQQTDTKVVEKLKGKNCSVKDVYVDRVSDKSNNQESLDDISEICEDDKNNGTYTIIDSSKTVMDNSKVKADEVKDSDIAVNTMLDDTFIDWQHFTLVGAIKEPVLEEEGKKVSQKSSKIQTYEPKLAIGDKFKSEEEVSNGEVTLKSLAGSLLRFRLTGPMSNSILVDVLQQANIVLTKVSEDSVKWWHKYYANPALSLGHSQKKEFWESVGQCLSPAELSPHCIIGLTVQDPRLGRPVKKTKIYPSETDLTYSLSASKEKTTESISLSPLWDSFVREEVMKTKMADYEINKLKEENLVSGFPIHLDNDESKIPILLVQNPGVVSHTFARDHDPAHGRGSGWDLILPKGWGRPFWLALVYREARCGGIYDLEHNAFEQSGLLFPHDFPDTVAGKKHQLEVEFSLTEKYNRKPPAKRPNFVKLGVPSPFFNPWFPLVKYWLEQDNIEGKQGYDKHASFVSEGADYFVLRERKVLLKLGKILEIVSLKFADDKSRHLLEARVKLHKLEVEVFKEVCTKYRNTLVSVRVDMLRRGKPSFCAQICIPSCSDLESLKANENYGGPVEPLHRDQKKIDHKKAKNELKEVTGKKKVKLKLDQTMKLFSDSDKQAEIQLCDRKVIGYLNSGGFSLGVGIGHGIGFCSTLGLYFLLKNYHRDKGLLVLVRNPTSRQYRFAKLSLIS